jgi:hypothetical protein
MPPSHTCADPSAIHPSIHLRALEPHYSKKHSPINGWMMLTKTHSWSTAHFFCSDCQSYQICIQHFQSSISQHLQDCIFLWMVLSFHSCKIIWKLRVWQIDENQTFASLFQCQAIILVVPTLRMQPRFLSRTSPLTIYVQSNCHSNNCNTKRPDTHLIKYPLFTFTITMCFSQF